MDRKAIPPLVPPLKGGASHVKAAMASVAQPKKLEIRQPVSHVQTALKAVQAKVDSTGVLQRAAWGGAAHQKLVADSKAAADAKRAADPFCQYKAAWYAANPTIVTHDGNKSIRTIVDHIVGHAAAHASEFKSSTAAFFALGCDAGGANTDTFRAIIAYTIENSSANKTAAGRSLWWSDSTGAIAIFNTTTPANSTCFRPARGKPYYDDQ